MGKIRRIVLDVLKPHEPTILDVGSRLSDLPGIDGVDLAVYGIEKKVESVKITIEGTDIDIKRIKSIIEDCGATIHSIDKATCGFKMIEEAETPQDID